MIYPPPLRQRLNGYERSVLASYSSLEEKVNAEAHAAYKPAPFVASEVPVFRLSQYNTGEISAAYYLSGSTSKVKPPSRSGPVVTTCFRQKAKSKVRRAVECSSVELKTFVTLTFSPRDIHLSNPELIDFYRHPLLADFMGPTYPVINHTWAKSKLINFRQALTMRTNRQIECKLKELPEKKHKKHRGKHQLRFLWTAELHESGNIHFHALTNKYIPVAYLRKIWAHGRSNIKKLNDAEHAARYMVKYMTKAGEEGGYTLPPVIDIDFVGPIPQFVPVKVGISGNRYNISANLRADSKPTRIYYSEDKEAIAMRKSLILMRDYITDAGGYVIGVGGFGCNLPRPRRSVAYRGPFGEILWTKAINRKYHDALLDTWFPVPF